MNILKPLAPFLGLGLAGQMMVGGSLKRGAQMEFEPHSPLAKGAGWSFQKIFERQKSRHSLDKACTKNC